MLHLGFTEPHWRTLIVDWDQMADDPMIRIVILYPAAASDAAKLERLARSRLPAAAATSAAIATQ
jgi:hypothetical protein